MRHTLSLMYQLYIKVLVGIYLGTGSSTPCHQLIFGSNVYVTSIHCGFYESNSVRDMIFDELILVILAHSLMSFSSLLTMLDQTNEEILDLLTSIMTVKLFNE